MNSHRSIVPALRIRVRLDDGATATAHFTEAYPQLGHVRVQGWLEAPSKSAAFKVSGEIAERLGIRCLGCYVGTEESEPANAPFSFDVHRGYVSPSYRQEEGAEALARVMKMLRSARHYFSR
jgi:hypothetical protein